MKIKILSDIHTEFGNLHMIPTFCAGEYDLLIIAGDLSNAAGIFDALLELDEVTETPILFVPGNHEYYGAQKSYIDAEFKKRCYDNITILNNKVIEIDDIMFIGSTGWWDQGVCKCHMSCMTDFKIIFDILPADAGMDWGKECRRFFEQSLEEYKDKRVVCISHNMPSRECISPEYQDSDINECFANRWDDLLDIPELWICGHTHDSFDKEINGTRVVCNPYGYYHRIENPEFKNNLIIEL